jgi:hypothetical protein
MFMPPISGAWQHFLLTKTLASALLQTRITGTGVAPADVWNYDFHFYCTSSTSGHLTQVGIPLWHAYLRGKKTYFSPSHRISPMLNQDNRFELFIWLLQSDELFCILMGLPFGAFHF